MRELGGVVKRFKRIGSRTEPCGAPQVIRMREKDEVEWQRHADVRDENYEVNHWREREDMPNQLERR